jgi:uncharacterized protein
MPGDDSTQPALPAGGFSSWLTEVRAAQRTDAGVTVPCGDCTACCTSSQFILIGPEETDTTSRIPSSLLFPAPGLPKGSVVMGYDDRGHCPMFVDGACSIYEHRPRTCRTYDCRVFPAAGLEPDGAGQSQIRARARQWTFDVRTTREHVLQAAVRAAARFLRSHTAAWPDGTVPRNPTQLAFLAVELHGLFLEDDVETGEVRLVSPATEDVEAAVLAVRARGRR